MQSRRPVHEYDIRSLRDRVRPHVPKGRILEYPCAELGRVRGAVDGELAAAGEDKGCARVLKIDDRSPVELLIRGRGIRC